MNPVKHNVPGNIRLQWINFAKGIGILLVVYGHVLKGLINLVYYRLRFNYGLLISLGVSIIYIFFHHQLGSFTKTLEYLLFFNLGILGYRYKDYFLVLIRGMEIMPATILLFIIAEYLYFNFGIESGHIFGPLLIHTGTLGSLRIIQLAEKAIFQNLLMFFIPLGIQSVPIYLVHILVTSGSRIFLMNFLFIKDPSINKLIGIILGISLPLFFYTKFIKNPYFSWTYQFPTKRKATIVKANTTYA